MGVKYYLKVSYLIDMKDREEKILFTGNKLVSLLFKYFKYYKEYKSPYSYLIIEFRNMQFTKLT